MAPDTDDPYESLKARIRATQDAVDRLADETAKAREQATESDAPPRRSETPPGGEAQEEIRALAALVELLRDVLPPDLRAQLAELVRQLLILVRAMLDWWIDRIDPSRAGAGAPAEPPVVEDIEIS